jgi:hypothetical protein
VHDGGLKRNETKRQTGIDLFQSACTYYYGVPTNTDRQYVCSYTTVGKIVKRRCFLREKVLNWMRIRLPCSLESE